MIIFQFLLYGYFSFILSLKASTQLHFYIIIVLLQQRIERLGMNKRITHIRIQKEQQSIQKQPIPSVVVRREGHLNFHFCFYNLEEQYKRGFYHGLLQLSEDYPFSPPKIKFLTNNGRFEVGKSICTTFTHYHKETWSSSWNIRTILTAMISFMYSNQKGIGGIFQTPQKRRSLATKSLQQNLKNQKFVQLFKDKLIELKLVTAEHINDLMHKPQKGKRRRRERSETTHADQVREIPQILQAPELLEAIGEEGMTDNAKKEQIIMAYIEEETFNRKRGLPDQELDEGDEIAQLEMFEKRRKMDEADIEKQEFRYLERQKTIQENEKA